MASLGANEPIQPGEEIREGEAEPTIARRDGPGGSRNRPVLAIWRGSQADSMSDCEASASGIGWMFGCICSGKKLGLRGAGIALADCS